MVSAREYQANLETQSFRTVRIPAVRGKILDRNGITLAENRPTYNVSLYLEELRQAFDAVYLEKAARARSELKQRQEDFSRRLNRKLTREERKPFLFTQSRKNLLRQQARYEVASNVVTQISLRLQQPISLNATNFARHYETRLALPYPVLTDLNPQQIARIEEQSTSPMGVDLEAQSTRWYPHGTTAAHLLGHLRRDDESKEGEEAFFSFRLPDYRGAVGIECGFDKELRGTAGAKSVLVNNAGYRQTENVWSPAEPGRNVVLTLDLGLQQAAERALQEVFGPDTRGAVVVMDVESGDILAMASSPTLDPNCYARGITHAEWQRIIDLSAEKNRATYENYMPGSIFKTVVGMAALEAGWNPEEVVHVEPNPSQPSKGCKRVGNHTFKDTAPPGRIHFSPGAEAFEQRLFHNLRPAHRSGAHHPDGPAAASGRTHGVAYSAGSPRLVPQPAAPALGLDGWQHRQHMHRPGPGVGHASAGGRPDGRHCQWRQGPLAPSSGSDRNTRTQLPASRP